MPQPTFPKRPADAAVLFADSASSSVFLDRMTGKRQLNAAGFDSCEGQVAGLRVVAATLREATCDYAKVIKALRAGHAPPVLIGAGISTPIGEQARGNQVVLASRVIGPGSASLSLVCPTGLPESLRVGVVLGAADSARSDAAIAANRWAYLFAKACEAYAQPAAVVTALGNAASLEEERAEQSRRHLARRAGALVRKVWKNPRSVLETAKQTTQRWEQQATLAEALETVLRRVP